MLEAKSISKRFGGQIVLKDASFLLRPEEVVGLVGYNGTGKTIFLDILTGKTRPDRGEVWADGKRFVPRPVWSTRSGVFRTYQVPRLFHHLSVVDNLRLGRWALNVNSSFSSDLANSHGDLVGAALSVGQRRRITLDWLRARLDCSRYFLLDEPAAGADENLAGQLLAFVESARTRGCGVLLVEHRDGILREACDRILYLHDGILSEEPPQNGSDGSPAIASEVETSVARLVARDMAVTRGSATIADHITFESYPGQVTVVTGPNGCGKSTLLHAIYGDPSCPQVNGELRFEGNDVRTMNLRGRIEAGIHLMPQDGSLFQSMTVEDVLQAGVQAVRPEAWGADRVSRLKEELPQLARIWNRKSGLLSGGERRFVSLARILLLEPRVALLDEPLAGLDGESRLQVAAIIGRMAATGVSVVAAEQSVHVPILPANTVVSLKACHRAN